RCLHAPEVRAGPAILDGEVLGANRDRASVDLRDAANEGGGQVGVCRVGGWRRNERAELLEAVGIGQRGDALPDRQPSLTVVVLGAFGATSGVSPSATTLQLLKAFPPGLDAGFLGRVTLVRRHARPAPER